MSKSLMGKLLLALVSGVLALELALQLGALLAPTLLSRSAGGGAGGELTILCVGDSHTFGVAVPKRAAYPSQLQARLDESLSQREVRVLNFGVPGFNAAQVASRLERQIIQTGADLVIVWAGINSFWNVSEIEAAGAQWMPSWLESTVGRLRIVRLAKVLWYTAQEDRNAPAVASTSDPRERRWRFGDEEVSGEHGDAAYRNTNAWVEQLQEDYARILQIARERDLPLILITYPVDQGLFARTNAVILDLALQRGVPILSSKDELARAEADGHDRNTLVIEAAGPHPGALLYRYVAESLEPLVLSLLDLPPL